MQNNYFRSKPLIYFLIGAFLLLITAESVPAAGAETAKRHKGPVVRIKAAHGLTAAQQEQFESLMEEGKRLYNNMDNEAAIQKFLQARQMAVTKEQKSDVYFYLSLAYYGLLEEGRSNEFSNSLNRLVQVDYYRQLDSEICPQRFIDMFEEIKKDYGIIIISSLPSGADVYINNSRTSSGMTPLTIAAKSGDVRLEIKKGKQKKKATLRVEAGKETQSPVYELKGGSSMLLILGGVLVAGGVGAALALGGGGNGGNGGGGGGGGGGTVTTGTIQVNSTPSGAQVYLDGTSRGTTPITLSSVSAGDHAVQVVKEGYLDFEQVVNVVANQTATVDATLGKHVININQPQQNSEWVLGEEMEIVWETTESASQGAPNLASLGGRLGAVNPLATARYSQDAARRRAASRRDAVSSSQPRKRSAVSQGIRNRIQQIQRSPVRPLSPKSTARGFNPALHNRNQGMGSKGGDVQISRLGTVRIDLLKSGEDILNIAESTENDGTFVWNIPEDLEADNDYKIKISSAESSEVSYTSSRFELRGASEVPKAPANLRFDPYQPTSPGSLTYFVTLRWADKSDNETGFKVQRQDTVNTNWKNVANLAANTKTYTDTGLKGDRQYTYRVVAYNDDGNSGYSNEVDVPILDYPTNVQALSLAGPKVGLSWTDNSSLETAYVIERKVDSGGWAVIGSTSANDTYFEDSSVSVGPTYSYRIRAVTDVSGETVYSAYSSTVSIKFN